MSEQTQCDAETVRLALIRATREWGSAKRMAKTIGANLHHVYAQRSGRAPISGRVAEYLGFERRFEGPGKGGGRGILRSIYFRRSIDG